MRRLNIGVLPDIVNALIATSIVSCCSLRSPDQDVSDASSCISPHPIVSPAFVPTKSSRPVTATSLVSCSDLLPGVIVRQSGLIYLAPLRPDHAGTSRSLYSLALAGQAPRILTKLNRNGVPYLCVCVAMGLACLAYLSVSAGVSGSSGEKVVAVRALSVPFDDDAHASPRPVPPVSSPQTAKVLGWWVSLVTASQLLNWMVSLRRDGLIGSCIPTTMQKILILSLAATPVHHRHQIMSFTWIRFNNAIKAQGIDRKKFLPYCSRVQPFAAWYALIMSTCVLGISGYTLFYPGAFAADQFIFACECWKGETQRSRSPRLLLAPHTSSVGY